MITAVLICIAIICLADVYPGGWLGGFAEMGSIIVLGAIPGVPWLVGGALDDWLGTGFLADAMGWLGTGVLVLIAAAVVVQSIARLVAWWRGEDEGVGEADHF